MPEDRDLQPYLRGAIWWVKGHRPDTGEYVRESLGTRDEAIAEAKVEEIYREARKRRLLGPDAPKPEDQLTFAAASEDYEPTPSDARYLVPIIRKIGRQRVREITPAGVRKLAKEMYPYASTDTWQRQVVTPIRAVINNAHELGKCPPIKIRRFDEDERIRQDRFRGVESRVPKVPGSWAWVTAFMAHADPRDAALAYFMFRHGVRVGTALEMDRRTDLNLGAGRARLPPAKGHAAEWIELDREEVVMIANLPLPYRGAARHRVFGIGGGRSGALYRRWKATCERAGIDYLPPHAAGRHGFGTEMIVRQGVDPVSAARQGRWSSPAVMLKTYSHEEDSAARVRDAFEAGKAALRTPAVQSKSTDRPKGRKAKAK